MKLSCIFLIVFAVGIVHAGSLYGGNPSQSQSIKIAIARLKESISTLNLRLSWLIDNGISGSAVIGIQKAIAAMELKLKNLQSLSSSLSGYSDIDSSNNSDAEVMNYDDGNATNEETQADVDDDSSSNNGNNEDGDNPDSNGQDNSQDSDSQAAEEESPAVVDDSNSNNDTNKDDNNQDSGDQDDSQVSDSQAAADNDSNVGNATSKNDNSQDESSDSEDDSSDSKDDSSKPDQLVNHIAVLQVTLDKLQDLGIPEQELIVLRAKIALLQAKLKAYKISEDNENSTDYPEA